jgi:hypothetical protein
VKFAVRNSDPGIGSPVAMYAASSKLGFSVCLLSTLSSHRNWAHHVAATLPQRRRRWSSSWSVGVRTLRIAPAGRRSVVALSDNNGNGATSTDGTLRPCIARCSEPLFCEIVASLIQKQSA